MSRDFNLELLDVDGRVVVLLDEFFGDEDRVLEVVTTPRHERHEDVTAKTKLALFRARTIRNHLCP